MNPAIMAAIKASTQKGEGATPEVKVEIGEGAGYAVILSLLVIASFLASLIALAKYVL